MITGLDLNATVSYTLEDDKDNPTVWKIGIIPSSVFSILISDVEGKEIETSYKVVQLGLKGWENWDVEFSTKKEKICGREMEVVPMDILDRLSVKCVSEIAAKIFEVNQITEKERKNS